MYTFLSYPKMWVKGQPMNLLKSSLGYQVEAQGICCFLQNTQELAEDYSLSKKNRISGDGQDKFSF